MADATLPRSPAPPDAALRAGLRASARAAAIAVASLALGTAAVLGLLFAAVALA